MNQNKWMWSKPMWDKLKQVKISKWISLIFFILLIYGLQQGFSKLHDWLTGEQSLPLSAFILTGNSDHVLETDVRKILLKQEDKLNFFTVDIEDIQHQLESMPWVYSVSIRKRWPDTLTINIVEQSIIAIWNDRSLLNRFGEIVNASPDKVRDNYVKLYGEDNQSNNVLNDYLKMNQLLKVNNLKVASLKDDKRHAANIILQNGIALHLGQEQKLDRIQRFLSVYPLIQEKYDLNKIDYVDLRYDTGFAIGWKTGE